MLWPADFQRVTWKPGQIISEGGEPYLMPFNAELKLIEEGKA